MANKALFEKFTNDIKRIWHRAPRGLITWNLFMVALLTLPILIDLRLFIFAQVIGSFFAFGIMLDNDLSNTSSPRNIWVLVTAFSWVMFVFMLGFGILQFAYKWTFGRMIEQDEVREQKHIREDLKNRYNQLLLEQGHEQIQIPTMSKTKDWYLEQIEKAEKMDLKKNQKLLGK